MAVADRWTKPRANLIHPHGTMSKISKQMGIRHTQNTHKKMGSNLKNETSFRFDWGHTLRVAVPISFPFWSSGAVVRLIREGPGD